MKSRLRPDPSSPSGSSRAQDHPAVATLRAAANAIEEDWSASPAHVAGYHLTMGSLFDGQVRRLARHVTAWSTPGSDPFAPRPIACSDPTALDALVKHHFGDVLDAAEAYLEARAGRR